MNSFVIRIGTRSSPLAIRQANKVCELLSFAHPKTLNKDSIEIVPIRTQGDKIQKGPLSELGGKGLFTKEIEEALLAKQIDIAVHSMKDVPTVFPNGLTIDCVIAREDPTDAIISFNAATIADLDQEAVVGTSSLRRRALLLNKRPNMNVVPLRGNVDTRLKKVLDGELDAAIVATAGLIRLDKLGDWAKPIPTDEMLPAVGQGVIGIERRIDDKQINYFLRPLNDKTTAICLDAERAFLKNLDGSCRTPIAALARIKGEYLEFKGTIVRPDGTESLTVERSGDPSKAILLGVEAAEELRVRGGTGFF